MLISTLSFSTDQLNYNVLPGQSVDVRVYLHEATGSTILLDEDGLWTAGVVVRRQTPVPAQPDPAFITEASVNDDFDDTLGRVIYVAAAGDEVSIFGSRDFLEHTEGVLGETILDGYRIWLGTFTIMGGASLGRVTTFDVSDDSESADTATWLNLCQLDLDPGINPAASFTVTVVPLPSGVLLCIAGMSASGALLRRRGVRHSSAAA